GTRGAGLGTLIVMVDDDGSGIVDPETLEETDLERLGLLEPIRADRIDHRDAERLPVGQQRLGVEQDAAVAPTVRRRTGAIDDDRIARNPIARVEAVVRVVDLLERQPPMLELGDESR